MEAVRAAGRREIWWNVRARQPGYHRLVFQVGEQQVEKELAVGDGFMRVSTQRPEWSWSDTLLNPSEAPFAADSKVRSIEIDYPERFSWKILGVDPWLVYWFVVSMVAGFCFK